MGILERAVFLRTSRQLCSLSTSPRNQLQHQNSNLDNALVLFERNPSVINVSSWNKLLSRCVRSNQIQAAEYLFDKMPVKDIVTWNTMLSAFKKTKNPDLVCKYFFGLQEIGLMPCERTVAILLSAFSDAAYSVLVPQIHVLVVCLGLKLSVFVGSALIRAYASAGDHFALGRVFDEIAEKNVASWNALISGYMELGCMVKAQRVFDVMPEKDMISWTNLVHGYIVNKRIDKARTMFDKMDKRDVVSWTVMISGYVQDESYTKALKLFRFMVDSGTRPNDFTFSCVLDACSGCSSLLMGQQVHSIILKSGIPGNVYLWTSLFNMYGKCGEIDAAYSIFESMEIKNLVSWNSIIGCYARHGLPTRALAEFERLIKCGVIPDQITFINVLSACAHGGLVTEGEKHFESMSINYGIEAELEHYTCMVDLYGRAGQLEKAEKLIKEMPFMPDVVLWGALLGACGLHSSLELGEFAAEGIRKMEKDHPIAYSMLSKIHGEREQWTNIIELRKIMKERGVRNQKAGSWIESPVDVS
ncbi:hypothetical protein K2173_011147 [Erythroxylum novogranatense]|uniref:Pentatricopeptide repeat-containing protein n=1 Tax=Erythroxylum novogranatense TaxID=1862640 RepID=A0AAV8U9N8_9ROSI|nr:hypothetical protein K2173_011147 [Erythroxylum novogranatense]